MSLSKFNENVNNHQGLPDKPTLPAEDLKILWDKAVNDIKTYINVTLTEEIDGIIENLYNSKAPNNHASVDGNYGLGNDDHYGHTKVINHLGLTEQYPGHSLNAYQGYVLNRDKAPNNHASVDGNYGLGDGNYYGHTKVIDNCNLSQSFTGHALHARQGFELDKKINATYNSIMNILEQLNQRVTALERKVN